MDEPGKALRRHSRGDGLSSPCCGHLPISPLAFPMSLANIVQGYAPTIRRKGCSRFVYSRGGLAPTLAPCHSVSFLNWMGNCGYYTTRYKGGVPHAYDVGSTTNRRPKVDTPAKGDAGTYPSRQRCFAASASHSDEMKGEASPPHINTTPAPTREMAVLVVRVHQGCTSSLLPEFAAYRFLYSSDDPVADINYLGI